MCKRQRCGLWWDWERLEVFARSMLEECKFVNTKVGLGLLGGRYEGSYGKHYSTDKVLVVWGEFQDGVAVKGVH